MAAESICIVHSSNLALRSLKSASRAATNHLGGSEKERIDKLLYLTVLVAEALQTARPISLCTL